MKKVTSSDVAKLANVSQTTVSLVLNNSGKIQISNETKERVFFAAKELGYKLNPNHKKKKEKSDQLLILTPNLTNYYFTELLQHVQNHAHQRGYKIIVCNTFRDSDTELYYLNNFSHVAGIIYTFLPTFSTIVEKLSETMPIVLIGEKGSDLNISSIELNNRMAGAMLAEHLYSLGHRRFVFISTPLRRFSLSREQRLQGMRETFQKYGLQNPISLISPENATERDNASSGVSFEYEIGRKLTFETLKNPHYNDVTAYIYVNDMAAIGGISALKKSNISIPQNISVAGFDNIFPATVSTPQLTSVDHQLEERCKSALDTLISLIENNEKPAQYITKIEYPPKMKVRASTGPVREDT